MKNHEFKLTFSVLACIAAVVLLFGIYFAYGRLFLQQPLQKQLLSNPEIRTVNVTGSNKQYRLNIELAPTANLQKTYRWINKQVEDKLGERDYKVVLKDNRDAKLEEFYYSAETVIFEALTDHRFVWLKAEIEDMALAKGIDVNLMVDESRVYIQLSDGVACLYEVIER